MADKNNDEGLLEESLGGNLDQWVVKMVHNHGINLFTNEDECLYILLGLAFMSTQLTH